MTVIKTSRDGKNIIKIQSIECYDGRMDAGRFHWTAFVTVFQKYELPLNAPSVAMAVRHSPAASCDAPPCNAAPPAAVAACPGVVVAGTAKAGATCTITTETEQETEQEAQTEEAG